MDQELFHLINSKWTEPWLDHLMVIASSSSLWLPFLYLLIILIALFGGFRGRALVVCALATLVLGDSLMTKTMKDGFQRPRPHESMSGVRRIGMPKADPQILAVGRPLHVKHSKLKLHSGRGRSFPSGHTVNNFSIATVFALFLRWGWLVYLPATLVSYSRIYTGSHWPSDVLVSGFLGIGVALLTISLLGWAWSKWGDRFLPDTHKSYPNILESTDPSQA